MKKDCYIVYSVTKDLTTGGIVEFDFLNMFETEEQARASLQFEADVCKYENGEEAVWVGEDALRLPAGWDPNLETTVHFECSVPFHDRDERPLSYLGDAKQEKPSLEAQIQEASVRLGSESVVGIGAFARDQETARDLNEAARVRNTVLDACYGTPGYGKLSLEDKNRMYDLVRKAVESSSMELSCKKMNGEDLPR